MKKLLAKLRHKALMYVFSKFYGRFVYAFEDADAQKAKMSDAQKGNYYEAISNWVTSDAYKIEMDGITRKFYRELATITADDPAMNGYRQVLIFIKFYEARLTKISNEYKEIQIIQKRNISLK